ncbi:uracil-DNA glycosylase family protein [Arenibacter sp. F20364]|uniref:uracil-DNA glycosylase family protein n=1 Tax=Arenibacter sp. F20364 TaxID=2926415 RepID=UPI001FF6CCFB|nr:uracil-DNA glycosylase family protein [Arenibacter sp. F20364]MCK0191319.1 uracil-DNA glycosylase family protein [Arenibacter sp. F20364]
MFLHSHPFEPFLFEDATKLIVGTLPPPRFTMGDLKEGDVNFCYGSRDGQLWPILDRIFGLNLDFETTEQAIQQRMDFLKERKIGICDIVQSAERSKIDASDLGMENIVLRDMFGYLKAYSKVDTLLFTGGNSKNGPEYFFRKYLKEHGAALELVSNEVPRVHQFELQSSEKEHKLFSNELPLPGNRRFIKTVSLTAPSGAANRAVGSLEAYKNMKRKNPEINTIDFRVMQYKEFF